MKYYYKVQAQFAKAGAPSFYSEGFKNLLEDAKDFFNTKSLIVHNPKEILECSILDSDTIIIRFCSDQELNLNQVSRSLRLFTMYLIDEEHKPNFRSLITGKRLFRMKAEKENHINYLPKKGEEEREFNDLDLIAEIIQLMRQDPNSIKLKKIEYILKNF